MNKYNYVCLLKWCVGPVYHCIDVCNARAGLETRNLNLAGVNPLPACKKLFLNANLACWQKFLKPNLQIRVILSVCILRKKDVQATDLQTTCTAKTWQVKQGKGATILCCKRCHQLRDTLFLIWHSIVLKKRVQTDYFLHNFCDGAKILLHDVSIKSYDADDELRNQ